MGLGGPTFMSKGHLHLQGLELVRDIRLGLGAHLLPRPLLDPIEFFIDIHLRGGMVRTRVEVEEAWVSTVFVFVPCRGTCRSGEG